MKLTTVGIKFEFIKIVLFAFVVPCECNVLPPGSPMLIMPYYHFCHVLSTVTTTKAEYNMKLILFTNYAHSEQNKVDFYFTLNSLNVSSFIFFRMFKYFIVC